MVYLLLFIVLGTTIGVFGFLFQQGEQKRRETRRQQEEGFRSALMHHLQRRDPSFRVSRLVREAGVDPAIANWVIEEVYGRIFGRAVSDGVVSTDEQRGLDQLATCLELVDGKRSRIEDRAKREKYREAVERSLGDGAVSQDEILQLDYLRTSLGLTAGDVSAAAGGIARDAYLAKFRQIIRHGELTTDALASLAALRAATGLSEADAYKVVREDAMSLYKERFCEIKQDGRVTADEEGELAALQRFLGLPNTEVQAFRAEIQRIRQKEAYRNGELPITKTTKLLEGGEVCHWDCRCHHSYETRAKTYDVHGELTITSQRIIFASPSRSFEFRASKIIDIEERANGVRIQTSTSKGTGGYCVENADLVAAVLEGVVRKHKYLAAENFSSTMSRHIPDTVKQEVWARDGGRCVKCQATDYLEFDHIIPHSKGGASTVNNVQLLCRRCNGLKGDRIG